MDYNKKPQADSKNPQAKNPNVPNQKGGQPGGQQQPGARPFQAPGTTQTKQPPANPQKKPGSGW